MAQEGLGSGKCQTMTSGGLSNRACPGLLAPLVSRGAGQHHSLVSSLQVSKDSHFLLRVSIQMGMFQWIQLPLIWAPQPEHPKPSAALRLLVTLRADPAGYSLEEAELWLTCWVLSGMRTKQR